LWAKLLVNAGDANRTAEVRRMHVDMLEQLSSFDAGILFKLYQHSDDPRLASRSIWPGIWTYKLPDDVVIEASPMDARRPSPEVELAISNLIRVGCLESTMMWRGEQSCSCVVVTALGRSLVQACSISSGVAARA